MFEVKEIETDNTDYKGLLKKSPQSSIWSDPSCPVYRGLDDKLFGVYKGNELTGGCLVHTTEQGILPYVPYAPWNGPIFRQERESENSEMLSVLLATLRHRFGHVTLTLPPELQDVRPATWAWMRTHVRYTYRGRGVPEFSRRVKVNHGCQVEMLCLDDILPYQCWELTCEDSLVIALVDHRYIYYWKANEKGKHHAEILYWILNYSKLSGLGWDLVGCNSPQRSLFKRGFGGKLTPYYAITTLEERDLREVPAGTCTPGPRSVQAV